MIAAVGWIDDLRTLPAWVRLLTQLCATTILVAGIGAWSLLHLPFAGTVALGWLGIAISFVWVVGLTNAYNFMDGIDGIAAVQGLSAGLGWCVLGCWLGEAGPPGAGSGAAFIATFGAVLAASCAGFLPHNWTPARIFLGDVGSAFLGFAFAALALVAARESPRLAVCGLLFVWPFVVDTSFTFARRLLHGENVFSAHRSHLYQRLVKSGWSHPETTLLYAALDLVGWILAFAYARGGPLGDAAAAVVPFAAVGLWLVVVREERRARDREPRRRSS